MVRVALRVHHAVVAAHDEAALGVHAVRQLLRRDEGCYDPVEAGEWPEGMVTDKGCLREK